MSRPRKILVADLLCGAGGSSTGCARALSELGLDMDLVCVNHWDTAIETHKKNHPEARHYVQDIGTVRPHLLVPEGYLDLLMASPTCTHHSVARGGKPTSDQQRSDPWHIITWLTELRVKRIIIENVWEFTSWGPVNARTGKPIQSRKGEYFHTWIDTIKRLGFEPEWRKLNAADYGDATTRQRFILMARSDRKRVHWPMPTHAKHVGGLELFPSLKPWRPARDIIDWSIKGRSIFDRKKPLAPKTLARIYAGAVKFGWPDPFLVVLRNHMAGQSVDGPLPTTAANGTHIGLAQPILIKQNFRRDTQSIDQPTPTITTVARVVEPFILNRHGDGYAEARAHSIDDPTPTANCDGGGYIVEPMIVNMKGQSTATDIEAPLPTQTSHAAHIYVAEPFVLSRHGDGAPRSTDEPTPTQVAKHSHCLISPYYGSGSGETCQSTEKPLPTVTSKGRFGMVVPVTHTDGSNRARDVENDPLSTLTTANRGELAFITAQFGEREGQAPRVHDVEQPTPAICATGHINLIEATSQYDILFRMLEPHELAAAMGFDDEETAYEFAGTKTEKIKQIGNAVSVAKMKACVSTIMADAAPQILSRIEAAE
jgi:DNA (cytosine-5)-methyltransferase 1